MLIRYREVWASFRILTLDCEEDRYLAGVEMIDRENTFILIRRIR